MENEFAKRLTVEILRPGSDWIAINKPQGMSVHNDYGIDALSVVEKQLGLASQPLPVHRLDRETSGVLILALHSKAARELQGGGVRENDLPRKIYRAVVKGKLEDGIWNRPLTDRAEGRKNPAGKSAERIPCETRYRVVNTNPFLTSIEVDLRTGRQHQIRKHSALAGHPIVGDLRYGDPKHAERIEKIFGLNRLFLHAHKMFIMGEEITAPTPPEFDQVMIPPPPPKPL